MIVKVYPINSSHLLTDFLYFRRYSAICALHWFLVQSLMPYISKLTLTFLSSRFFCKTNMPGQKCKYLQNKKSFLGKMKSIFHHFQRVFSCGKTSQAREWAFENYNERLIWREIVEPTFLRQILTFMFSHFCYILIAPYKSQGLIFLFKQKLHQEHYKVPK